MFDPGMVITSVQRNQSSSSWRIMRGKSHMGCAVVGAVLLLGFGGLVVVLVGAAAVGSLGSTDALPSLLIALGVLLLFGGLCLWGALAMLRFARKEGRSLLVLVPDGVVECYRGKADKITALHFDGIRRMDMNTQTVVSTDSEGSRRSSTSYWLNVYDTAGRYQKWDLRQTYGDPIVIGGTIIAAYEEYRHHQSQHP
jgi:hypothetical protein